ncbi:type II toxin-antitoxin system VapC family toxin [Georgenia yuyongxinii]|uniref:Ribonuclease VapC n=1 Tax=Georgenia yuyongxinii TaxID=2589797 RepID=A0A552WMI9_9MICO|nr:PIN domain-containing protein [Georgenia yuyongxinii]TRW43799.1 PIN domain-containing protein [Georgenia yuyongxinii]
MIVVDASALVDVLVGQEHADWVLERMTGDELVAPAHQVAEVLSAITRLERAGTLTAEAAADAVGAASSLPQRLIVPTGGHIRRAFELRARLRVLDGLYVALAEELDVPLLTTDHRLARAEPRCTVLVP